MTPADLLLMISLLWTLGCGSTSHWFKKQQESAEHRQNIASALSHEEQFNQLKSTIEKEPRSCPGIESELMAYLRRGAKDRADLVKIVDLYLTCPNVRAHEAFTTLMTHKGSMYRHAAWRIAAARPSNKMSEAISRVLSEALANGNVTPILKGVVANAVAKNQIKEAYSFLRHGLFRTQKVPFASAMAELDPDKARDDFLIYLSTVDLNDLQTSNTQTSPVKVIMLNFFLSHPPSLHHPNFSHLFFYALSTNKAYAEITQSVLMKLIEGSTNEISQVLAKQSDETQRNYLNLIKDHPSSSATNFLNLMSKIHSEKAKSSAN